MTADNKRMKGLRSAKHVRIIFGSSSFGGDVVVGRKLIGITPRGKCLPKMCP